MTFGEIYYHISIFPCHNCIIFILAKHEDYQTHAEGRCGHVKIYILLILFDAMNFALNLSLLCMSNGSEHEHVMHH